MELNYNVGLFQEKKTLPDTKLTAGIGAFSSLIPSISACSRMLTACAASCSFLLSLEALAERIRVLNCFAASTSAD